MHGCKYGVPACPVAAGTARQEYPCEFCAEELAGGGPDLAYLLNGMYDKGYAAAEAIADDEIDRAVKNAMSESEID